MQSEIDEILHNFKKVPGWDRFLLPECIYEKYNIPKPKTYSSLRDYLSEASMISLLPSEGNKPIEIREPDGKLREMPSMPTLEISYEHPEEKPQQSGDSTESNVTKTQE